MNELIIVHRKQESTNEYHPVAATGHSFEIHEWSGSGLSYLHVHYADDEAWHIFEENLTFRFGDKQVEAPLGQPYSCTWEFPIHIVEPMVQRAIWSL